LRGGGEALPWRTVERFIHWRGGTGVEVEMVCARTRARKARKRGTGMGTGKPDASARSTP